MEHYSVIGYDDRGDAIGQKEHILTKCIPSEKQIGRLVNELFKNGASDVIVSKDKIIYDYVMRLKKDDISFTVRAALDEAEYKAFKQMIFALGFEIEITKCVDFLR